MDVLAYLIMALVGTVFFLDDAVEAYRLSETGHARGKVMLRMK